MQIYLTNTIRPYCSGSELMYSKTVLEIQVLPIMFESRANTSILAKITLGTRASISSVRLPNYYNKDLKKLDCDTIQCAFKSFYFYP